MIGLCVREGMKYLSVSTHVLKTTRKFSDFSDVM